MVAKLGESADQQIEFVEVGGHVGSVLMLQRFERFERSVDVALGETVVTVEEVFPCRPTVALCSFQNLHVGRSLPCGSIQLLV